MFNETCYINDILPKMQEVSQILPKNRTNASQALLLCRMDIYIIYTICSFYAAWNFVDIHMTNHIVSYTFILIKINLPFFNVGIWNSVDVCTLYLPIAQQQDSLIVLGKY